MIKLIEEIDFSIESNMLFTKIKSNHLAYNKFDFCRTYKQIDNNKKLTAVFNILNSAVTLLCFDNTDFFELNSFLHTIGTSSVFCDINIEKELDYVTIETGYVLKFIKTSTEKHNELTTNPNYKSIYSQLDWADNLPDYDNFLSDLSYRFRYGFSRIIETDFGVVFTGWETKTDAVVSTLSVKKLEQNKGFGSKLIQSICYYILKGNKNIFVYCNTNKNKEFYEKNGFKVVSEYCVLKEGNTNE